MADIRKQKLEDYVQQLINEEFTSRIKHLKAKQENQGKVRKEKEKKVRPRNNKQTK